MYIYIHKNIFTYINRGSNGSRLKAIRMQVMTLNNLPYVPAKLVKEINSKDDVSKDGMYMYIFIFTYIYVLL
jgi:hypothetical protein